MASAALLLAANPDGPAAARNWLFGYHAVNSFGRELAGRRSPFFPLDVF